jgi:anti-sigma factor RsiW
MNDCQRIDPIVTPFVDGELSAADRDLVAEHVRVCAPCYSRVTAERAVRALIHARKSALDAPCASGALRAKCAEAARQTPRVAGAVHAVRDLNGSRAPDLHGPRGASRAAGEAATRWRTRLAPVALAASLVVVVGGAFVYQITDKSARVMAAELTADHVKCFAMNSVLHTHDAPTAVESSMISGFGWQMRLPDEPARAGLELVGARPCLYGEGKVAHIMYRHQGRPVSLFMLPNASRSRELVEVFGHQAAIWCVGNRTFVLISREPKREVEQMASFVQASLR